VITYDIQSLYGAEVVGSDGSKLGTIDELYVDDATQQPSWATVKTGLFGRKVAFVPLATAQWVDDHLQVPYDKQRLSDAPHFDGESPLGLEQEEELFNYYGVPRAGAGTVTTEPSPATFTATTTDPEVRATGADDAMTRSEEQLRVGVEQREAGRARLRKYVVTQTVTQTVPVSHEEVRVEREPITDANRNAAMSGPEISEAEHEVVLHEERPVVEKETVPVERVRLSTETVADEETVSADVRKERIETEGVTEARPR
jgi:uncharacterized protein (TIGR02271 family)